MNTLKDLTSRPGPPRVWFAIPVALLPGFCHTTENGRHVTHNDRDLSPHQKTCSEALLCALESYFAEVDRQHLPVSREEADDAINEGLRSTRPNYRTIGERNGEPVFLSVANKGTHG